MLSSREVAEHFAQLVVQKKWAEARAMLTPALQGETSAADIQEAVESMTSYVHTPLTEVHVMETMDDWPNKQEDDGDWVYVALSGDGFSEAVTVITKKEGSRLYIRSLEWGRP